MDENYSDVFMFLLYSDGTFAWFNTANAPSGEPVDAVLGKQVWNRFGPNDKDQIRDAFTELMLDHQSSEFHTVVRNIAGRRLSVSAARIPVVQRSQHVVVGWCRRLSDDVLELTGREREILLLVCDELTSEQIAKQLQISPSTVETHRQNLAKKLGTSSAVGQVRAAIRGGLIEP